MEMAPIEVMIVFLCLTNVCVSSSEEDYPCPTDHPGTKCCSDNCDKRLCFINGTCRTCKSGNFGEKCQHGCNKKCKDDKCNRIDGGCSDGCIIGHFGQACEFPCNSNCRKRVCDRKTGSCSLGCKDGYYGLQCRLQCPLGCCICSPENGTCLIDECEPNTPNYMLIVAFGSAGFFLLVLVTSIISYRSYIKRSVRQEETTRNNLEVTRPPIEVPELPNVSRNDSHYDEIGDYYNTRKHMSRSLDSIDKPPTAAIQVCLNPDRSKRLSLPKKNFRNTFAKRRVKSLSSSTSSLDSLPSCWVGTGQSVFELFNVIPEGHNSGMAASEGADGPEESTLGHSKEAKTDSGDKNGRDHLPMIAETKLEDEATLDAMSVTSGKSEVRKGYISAVFEDCEAKSLLHTFCKQKVIAE